MEFVNPYEVLLQAVKNLYGDFNVHIEFDASFRKRFVFFGHWGETCFPDDNGPPTIKVSAHLPVIHSLEIIAHELAHVIAGQSAGHNREWEEIFEKIYKEWEKLAE